MQGTDVSVVLLVRNQCDLLPISLAHLELQTLPAARYEVLVVDQSDSAETQAVLERYAGSAPVRTRWFGGEARPAAAARNLALQHAQGTWVLFLNEDLLAGPELVEQHVRDQERHGGRSAIRGRIAPHPQVDPRVFMSWYELPPAPELRPDQPLRFLDWHCHNLSLPRAPILAVGGFVEEPALEGAEDLELAWRLEQDQVCGFYSDRASAFTWRPTTVASETTRYYSAGYALHELLRKTQSDILRQRYRPFLSRRRAAIDRIVTPLCHGVAPLFAATSRPFAAFCRRSLRHAFWRGHRDAARGRPRRHE